VATPPGLLLWDFVTRHGWIDFASAQALLACAIALFIPLRSGSPRLRDASNAFVAALLLAGGAARLAGLIAWGGLAWDPFSGMPAPVALGAIALGSGLLFVRRGAALLGAPVAGWRQIPVTVAIAIAALSCVLWRSLSMERAQAATSMDHREVMAVAADVRRALDAHADVVRRLAGEPATSPSDWARHAHAQLAIVPALAAVAWVDPSLTTRLEIDEDPNRRNAIDLKAMLTVSEAIARSAQLRKESRGGHARLDFPKTEPEFGTKNTVVKKDGEAMAVGQSPLPEMPAELRAIVDAELEAVKV